MADKTLARISALLRKAESTDNEHEADAYLKAAQRLATLASIDLAVARSHAGASERRAVPAQRTVEIGASGKRGLRTYVQLFAAIALANDVRCDVARDSSRVFAYGFDTDIDAAQALYASLAVQMARACEQYLASGDHRLDSTARLVRTGRRWEVEERPVHTTTARINFQQAFAARVGARLTEAREQARDDAQRTPGRATRRSPSASGSPDHAEPVPQSPAACAGSVALVLRAKELELTEHYKAHSTARGTWSGNRAPSAPSARSWTAGDRAGRRARLGGEQAIGGGRPQVESR